MGQRCDHCTIKHRKCDRASPVCSPCARIGEVCTYTSSSPANVNKPSPADVKKRSSDHADKPNPVPTNKSSPRTPGAACSICRRGKRRCDKARPVCGPCKKRGVDCVYNDNSALRRPSKKLMSSRLASTFVNEDDSDKARDTSKLMRSSSTMEMGEHKSLGAERKDGPARRTSTGSFISSMRAATSSISDSVSERGEKQDEPDRPRKFPRLTPSTSITKHEDRASICAEKKDQPARATSEGSSTSSTSSASTATPTVPHNSTPHAEKVNIEPASSRPSSHHKQAFYTPDPQPREEDEVSEPPALANEPDDGEIPGDKTSGKISPEPQPHVGIEMPGLSSHSDQSDNDQAHTNQDEVAAAPSSSAFPDEHEARETLNGTRKGDEPEPESDDSSEVSSDSELPDQSENVQMRNGGRNRRTVPESHVDVDEEAEEPRPSAIFNGVEENNETNDKKLSDNKRKESTDSEFMVKLRRNIQRRIDASKLHPKIQLPNERRLEAPRRTKVGGKSGATDGNHLMLPDRDHADHLISEYLAGLYANLPVLDLSSFQADYQALFSANAVEDDTDPFPVILNIVFALGSLSDTSQLHSAEMYFTRAENLMPEWIVRGQDIGHVQLHILSSQYLIATNDLCGAWQSIGSAIRIAQSLWLHLSHGGELSRAIWYGCVVMERIIATHMGAAPQVTPQAFKTPLPTDLEEHFAGVLSCLEHAQEVGSPPITEFFAALVRLYEGYEDIVKVEEKYTITDENPLSRILEHFDGLAILEVDQRLCHWKTSLPSRLDADTADNSVLEDVVTRRQQYVLRVRYLHMRLRLWRPFLAITAAFPDINKRVSIAHGTQMRRVDTPLTYALVQEGAFKCLLAAHGIMKVITDAPHDAANPTGFWWENIEYAFACAAVFLAARVSPLSAQLRLGDRTGDQLIDEGWQLTVQFLEGYSTSSFVAGKCISALNSMAEVVLDNDAEEEELPENRIDDDGVEWRKHRDVVWINCLPADIPD